MKILSEDKMKKYLIDRNIGYDFKTKKNPIVKWKGQKLIDLYRICVDLNNYGDISLINSFELPDFDLFNFSFPCTDISVAGQQQGMKDEKGGLTRSGMYIYGMNIIKTKKPKYIMIENVKNLVGRKFKTDFDEIVQDLENNNYNVYWKVLNAKNYGVPQNRERVFAVCIRKDVNKYTFEFPEEFDNGIRLKDLLQQNVEEKYYISQEKTEKLISQLKDKNSLKLDMCQAKREGHPREYTDFSPTLSARDYKEPRLINELIKVGNINPSEKGMNGCVYNENGLSPTITTNKGEGSKILTQEVKSCSFRTRSYMGQVQQLEIRKDNESNTVTSVPKDSMILEINPNEINVIGRVEGINGHDLLKRVYDTNGISPTLDSCSGGNRQPKILEDFYTNRDIREYVEYSPTLRADRQGLKVAEEQDVSQSPKPELVGGIGEINYGKQYRQGNRVYSSNTIAMCLLSQPVGNTGGNSYLYEVDYRIRKLTPLECVRLMNFDDEDYNRMKAIGISDSGIYKLCGNSIVVACTYYIFKNLLNNSKVI